MKKVIAKRKDIAFYIKMLPLVKIHPKAYDTSKAIMCEDSNESALKLLEDAFNKKEIPKPSCDKNVVDETMKLANRLGISGTPTIIFKDGRLVSGAVQAEELIKMIDRAQER